MSVSRGRTLSPAEARARRLEQAGDLGGAIAAYEQALASRPGDPDLLAGLAALAERMRSAELALSIWSLLRAQHPQRIEAVDGQARALRQLGRLDEGAQLLRSALAQAPGEHGLWTSLGAIRNEQGDVAEALACFDTAITLGARSAAPYYNRGGVRLDLGDAAAAAEDFAEAQRLAQQPGERAAADFAVGLASLSCGDLAAGWRGYEARLAPAWAGSPVFHAAGTMWTPKTPLDGAHLMVLGEQGVGDQLMFANVLDDVQRRVGEGGRLTVAVDRRLAPLFRRSFPEAQIVELVTELRAGRAHHRAQVADGAPVELWAPLGSLLQCFRPSLDAFPGRAAYLQPSSERVAHWRAWLGEGAPAVGLSWRSRSSGFERRRSYPPPEAWRPVLATPGIRLVNLQYDVAPEDLAALGAWAGREVLQPPGLDLRDDLDDLAALCVALDRVVSIPNATGVLAAACGAQVSFVDPPAFWRRLGTGCYPWHPRVKSYPAGLGAVWEAAIAALAADLSGLAPKA